MVRSLFFNPGMNLLLNLAFAHGLIVPHKRYFNLMVFYAKSRVLLYLVLFVVLSKSLATTSFEEAGGVAYHSMDFLSCCVLGCHFQFVLICIHVTVDVSR